MTVTLIVLAHPEPGSFTGSWAAASAQAAREAGDDVLLSDLCAMGFDAVERPSHYANTEEVFDPLKAQEHGALPAEIEREIAKLLAADRVIFHFPMWWFGPPAVLKGWFDRVLAHGHLHDVEHRFDTGRLVGRSALFCVSTGADAVEASSSGREGDARLLLWPAAMTLRYLGLQVLEPVLVHGVHGYHTGAAETALRRRLEQVVARQGQLLREWDQHPRMPFNADAEFDANGRLRPDAPVHSPFIRRPG